MCCIKTAPTRWISGGKKALKLAGSASAGDALVTSFTSVLARSRVIKSAFLCVC